MRSSEQNVKSDPLPILVLLPGMDGTGLLFENLLTVLADQLEVVVAHYPTQIPLDYVALQTIVRGFLPQDKPYVLLAESFSGPLAIAIAASQPANLQGLLLSATFASNPRPWLRPLQFLLQRRLIAAIPLAWFDFFLLGPFATDALRCKITQVLSQVTPEVLRVRAKAVLSVDERVALSRIDVPMLYLQSARDRAVPRRAYAEIQKHASHCHLAVFQAPHFLLQVMPDMVAETILAFVERCAKKRPLARPKVEKETDARLQ